MDFARILRRNLTDAERTLWQKLRHKQLKNLKFRRQQQIGPYIVDFVTFEKKVVIEVDGGQHAVEKDEDRERERWLQGQGFEVVRYWNNHILESIESVMEDIVRRVSKHRPPSPQPSPVKGEEDAPD
jgi:very-short-patch-repair endonuclease